MESNLSLHNKNILVTGVSRASGIGAAIAKTCVQAGANVIVHGNPQYDAKMEYPDASMNFCFDLEREYNVKAINPLPLSLSPSLSVNLNRQVKCLTAYLSVAKVPKKLSTILKIP